MDTVVNRFGDYLLDLCKAAGMRIVNGRIFPNTDKMTCFTHNGESVVDYLITSENNFSSLSYMIVHDYTFLFASFLSRRNVFLAVLNSRFAILQSLLNHSDCL